jgi:hypothetical protein
MDVVMVDVLWQGLSAARKVADLAETYELNVAPHNYNGHLSTLAAVDLGADTIYAISASQPSIEMSGGSLAQADVLGLCLTVPVSAVYRRSMPTHIRPARHEPCGARHRTRPSAHTGLHGGSRDV